MPTPTPVPTDTERREPAPADRAPTDRAPPDTVPADAVLPDPAPRDDERFDVIVIGGGPAGLTAATYLARFHRRCVVLDAGDSRARWIPESHNCPGFPSGVAGTALLDRMRAQAAQFGARLANATVTSIEPDGDGFLVGSDDAQWRAGKVMLACGTADVLPDVPWIEDAVQCGAVRICAVCDAFEATDGRLGVYGPADSVIGHARFLRSYSRDVSVLPIGALAAADRDAATEAGIACLAPDGTLAFDGRRCRYEVGGEAFEFDTVYPYLGFRTCKDLIRAAGVRCDDAGEIVVDRHQMTSVPGLYAIGDMVSGLNQIAAAVGHAAVAATHAHNTLPPAPR
ncbi:NAD(P)/FAD-dependent oxidoreductase [Cognatilysobacter tabacisoli]|uniref:NAD(P)/FAD-dependent oxidoreductase n=1 Tax=Cognatilysobacter tabacisoli TaxID=2315424 RepID=UPI000E6AF965|nr:NAD(P)/FAD-dependent oxidoreductase [Lysobacter tabacisoli]